MTSPFFRTTKCRTGPRLSANTSAQKPLGNVSPPSHATSPAAVSCVPREQAAAIAVAAASSINPRMTGGSAESVLHRQQSHPERTLVILSAAKDLLSHLSKADPSLRSG